jgi:hypothetical protein
MLRSLVRVLAATLTALAIVALAKSARAGYSHYWTWKRAPNAAELEPALAEMERLVESARDDLSDEEGREGKTAVFRVSIAYDETSTLPGIDFNGVGSLAHEPFRFPVKDVGDADFSFVKTVGKPYDVVVVACLIVARDHFPKEVLEISSDGTWADEWQAGADLYEKVLGREAHDPLPPVKFFDEHQFPPNPDDENNTDWRKNLIISAVFFGALVTLVIVAKRA